ncbi:MAG TPA: lysophospholipid acyltransferase family protein [Bryobacteraceae bacterium]|nr:lysophospholipid acyltransferase family protein [Bryobacteraceae bacterium]
MRDAIAMLLGQKLPAPVEGALERLLLLDRLDSLYQQAQLRDDQPFADRFLTLLNVRPRVSGQDLALVPKQGPVVAVANHPFGLIEGAVLAALLRSVRPDIKIMANHLLAAFPETSDYCVFVDPFGGGRAIRANQRGLKDSIAWLKRGGLLGVFPAGEVACWNLKERAVIDPEWSQTVARLVRITGASVLPMFFGGANSALFQLLGLLHPRVRTALLPHEFFNKHDRVIDVRIGSPIPPAKLRSYQDDVALTRYLRHRTYLLQNRETPRKPRGRLSEPPAAGVLEELLASEIAKLSPDRTLIETEEFSVLLATAQEAPNVLHEIGRLREVTFRQAGEGTGKAVDLDACDDHYWHLFVWNRRTHEIAGAYRLAPSDEIVSRFGPKGLYTSSLFQWKQSFLDRISPALELGRSFVRPEYQKTYAPLLLLWKGIGQFLVRNPRFKVLFGPVSISNDYTATSRHLMVKFLNAYRRSPELAPLVRARNPLRQRPSRMTDELIGATVWDVEELSALIADIETDRKGVPVLLRQYLKLGGELVAFHVDRAFGNTLDGLIVVDLRRTHARLLERYMGKQGAAQFLRS